MSEFCASPGTRHPEFPTSQLRIGGSMFGLKMLSLVSGLVVLPLVASSQQVVSTGEILDKVVAQEQAEIKLLRQYSPLVETYIQYVRLDSKSEPLPAGDKYFLGRAKLGKGIELEPLEYEPGIKRTVAEDWREFLNIGFVPGGFLQMIYVDTTGFDRQHYKFEYVRREFLGEVRCLVFEVTPLNKNEKGRFVGRIWVEDQDYHIVRFNGSYGESFLLSKYFNFDSWRNNAVNKRWLPSFIYIEQGNFHDPQTKRLAYKPFRAQTRLWGYHVGYAGQEEELSKLIVETPKPLKDLSENNNDLSPVQAQRAWEQQAEANVTDYLQRQGLLAPHGEVDKVLETVVNNLEVTNNLDLEPEVRCRVLMTSTLESFSVGHTIVLSRGLVDVLPDEASLAAILAHELGHIVLAQGMDTEFAFFNSLHFRERDTFRHFAFARSREEEQAAQKKANELLENSPYNGNTGAARSFLEALKTSSRDFPNLVSAHLGDRIPTNWAISAAGAGSAQSVAMPGAGKPAADEVAALPLGTRVKVDPWSDQLQMVKARHAGEDEKAKMSFQIAPFVLYLARQEDTAAAAPVGGVAAAQ